MSAPKKIKVQLECGELKHTVEGDAEEAIREIVKFLSSVYPIYDVASKLIYAPDYVEILENVSEFVNFAPSGEAILLKQFSSTDAAIGAILLAADAAHKLGKRESNSLSVEELARALGKAEKTVRNTLSEMIKAGVVERVDKGTYRITVAGIREVNESMKALKESESG